MTSSARLVQLFLPLRQQDGSRVASDVLSGVRQELVERFGGVTAHLRAPARGLWKDDGSVERDDVVIVEVVVENFDRAWWTEYKTTLETRFAQKSIHARVTDVVML
jgi:hypothetical protein